MKIRKSEILGFDTLAKVEDSLNIHNSEYIDRYENNINKQYSQPPKIRDLHLHIANGGTWEFIDKTVEEETADKKIEAGKLAEKEKQDRIILAQTDGAVRDQLITELMSDSGFTPEKTSLAKVQKDEDGKDMSQYFSDRSSKLSEIKLMIANA